MKFSIVHERRKRLWWTYVQTLYELEEDHTFIHLDGNTYTIPRGFRTDGASIPWYLRWMYRQDGPWFHACVIHDFLYDKRIGTRLLVDLKLLLDLSRNPKVPNRTAEIFYFAVRVGGKSWWKN